MAEHDEERSSRGLLPSVVITPSDLAEVRREADSLDEFMRQADLRKGGESNSLPRMGKLLKETVELNNLNLLKEDDRASLIHFLEDMTLHAPTVHISFSADPPAQFLTKIINWFRKEINPQILIQVGLQPSIAAGCIVHTSNRVFDLSLRKYLYERKHILIDKLNETRSSHAQP